MSDGKYAWIVCQGEYSDRFVRAVFLTEKAAEAWVGDRKYLDIEEVALEPEMLETAPTGYSGWYVQMWPDGVVRQFGEQPDMEVSRYRIHDFEDYYMKHRSGVILEAYVWARDKQHAIKIVNEKRAQIIASDQWAEGFMA